MIRQSWGPEDNCCRSQEGYGSSQLSPFRSVHWSNGHRDVSHTAIDALGNGFLIQQPGGRQHCVRLNGQKSRPQSEGQRCSTRPHQQIKPSLLHDVNRRQQKILQNPSIDDPAWKPAIIRLRETRTLCVFHVTSPGLHQDQPLFPPHQYTTPCKPFTPSQILAHPLQRIRRPTTTPAGLTEKQCRGVSNVLGQAGHVHEVGQTGTLAPTPHNGVNVPQAARRNSTPTLADDANVSRPPPTSFSPMPSQRLRSATLALRRLQNHSTASQQLERRLSQHH